MSVSSMPTASGLPNVRPSTSWLRLLLGLALAGLGLVLVIDQQLATSTLALLTGAGLVLHGLHDLLAGDLARPVSLLSGVVWVVAGVMAMAWPDATLWALAVITGMGCVAAGTLQITAGLLARGEPGHVWLLALGALSVVVGLAALAWPEATVAVLALLLGVRAVIAGVGLVAVELVGERPQVPA
jgi:uncharacterized membrane protein HdeD (DUF308 family)